MLGGRPRLAYQPALDGVRGFAVALVLAFHAGFGWMTGGYVGVSVFFTLSGFLITGLLVAEHDATATISLRGFYGRRVRRLLPASLTVLGAIGVATATGSFAGLPHLRRDVLAALAQVANWNALHAGTSYADLVTRSAGVLSPVDHFWSLSVEEQFYWVWPLACLALLRIARPGARRAVFVGLAVTGLLAAPFIAHVWGPDAAYWATPARLGEILVGAALAVLTTKVESWPRWLGAVGATGLAVIVWAAITWPAGSGPAYQGWFGAFALASAALIVGLQVDGPLRRVFAVRPLVALGTISYGVYLYHWPVYALITGRGTGLAVWPLFGVRVAVTLAVAIASYVVIEQPIRRGKVLARLHPALRPTSALAAVAAVAVIAVAAIPVPATVSASRSAGAPSATFAVASRTSVTVGATAVGEVTAPTTAHSDTATGTRTGTTVAGPVSTASPSGLPPSTTSPGTLAAGATTAASAPGAVTTSTLSTAATPTTAGTPATPVAPVRILMMGDSTAETLSVGMQPWAATATRPVEVASIALPGCGLIRKAAMFGDPTGSFRRSCDKVLDHDLPAALTSAVPDVVAVLITLPDSQPRQWSVKEGMLHPTDARYIERLLADDESMIAELTAAGVHHIAWIVPPAPATWWVGWVNSSKATMQDWSDYVATIDTLAARHPNVVDEVHLDSWLPSVEHDQTWRPDGLHWTAASATGVFEQYLGDALIAAASSG